MSQISASIRLRPIRFAFLVRPNDRKRLLEIFRINTCLWGGKFNPIIPYMRQVPTWWDRHGHRFETAKQILNGYLDCYEPDFLVEAENGLAKGLGFDPKRVLKLTDLLCREDHRKTDGNGLSTYDVYKHLHLKEFQFERRHKHNIANIIAEDSTFDCFSACVFGGFPKQNNLNYFKRAFKQAFDPLEVLLNSDSLSRLYGSGVTSALDIGCSEIEVDFNNHSSTSLFVLDALESRDLIDYWNLRSLQSDIIAVPVQWLEVLSPYCREIVKKSFRTIPGNQFGITRNANVIFSRSIPNDAIKRLHKKYIAVDIKDANMVQDFYPPIWRPTPKYHVRSSRPTLSAGKKTVEVQYTDDKPDVWFEAIHPEFSERYGNENRWANVIKLTDWSFKGQIATILPTEYRHPKFSPFGLGSNRSISTTEGFVTFHKFRDTQQYWKLLSGASVIAKWLETSGVQVKLSDAGRATQQIIQTLDGLIGVRNIANAGVIKLLNKISRKPITRSMQQKEFFNRITNEVKDNIWLENAARNLIAGNAVELGLELKCSKCSSWSWLSLKQLDYKVNCSLCLREFGFPVIEPNNNDCSRWAYRLIGPFALPEYANGGYASALAVRFFSEIIDHQSSKVAWAPGHELKFSDGSERESDFILWYQRTNMFGTDYPTEIVFGEAKSFGREGSQNPIRVAERAGNTDVFKQDDITRMKDLALAFPGAVIVFATMKDASDLTNDEIARLRKLAEWGREYQKDSTRTRAPLIILTGTELFAGHSLQLAWEDKGGKHIGFSKNYPEFGHLKTLADLTQQLYLGMPSYYEWRKKKWVALQKRRQNAVNAVSRAKK